MADATSSAPDASAAASSSASRSASAAALSEPDTASLLALASRKPPASRLAFTHEGRVIYEWEQDLEEVHVYIPIPTGARARDFAVTIGTNHVKIGLRGNPPYLDVDTASAVVAGESTWILEDGSLHMILVKSRKASTWEAAFAGHGELSAAERTHTQRKMLLERFQSEHPGFDFSGAEVNGSVPDPRTFMGGVKH